MSTTIDTSVAADQRKGSDSSDAFTPATTDSNSWPSDDDHRTGRALTRRTSRPSTHSSIPEERHSTFESDDSVQSSYGKEPHRELQVVNPDEERSERSERLGRSEIQEEQEDVTPKRNASQRSNGSSFPFRRVLSYRDPTPFDLSRLRHDIEKLEHLILELREATTSRKTYDDLVASYESKLERHQLDQDKAQFAREKAELNFDKQARFYEFRILDFQRDINKRAQTIDTLQRELTSIRESWRRLLEDKTSLREERKTLKKQITALEETITDTKSEVIALQIQKEDILRHTETHPLKLAEMQAEVERSRQEVDAMHHPKEVAALRDELEKTKEEYGILQARVLILQNHCQDMHVEHGVPLPSLLRKEERKTSSTDKEGEAREESNSLSSGEIDAAAPAVQSAEQDEATVQENLRPLSNATFSAEDDAALADAVLAEAALARVALAEAALVDSPPIRRPRLSKSVSTLTDPDLNKAAVSTPR